VDAHSHTAHRRHAVLHGAQEILVELHRLRIPGGGAQRLRGQSITLDHRIYQLRVAGCELRPEDDQVPGFGEPRIAAVLTGERAYFDRVVAHERRSHQGVLDELLEKLQDHFPGAEAVL